MDVGCGRGSTARKALELGASYVLGIEISSRRLAEAWDHGVPGRLEFRVADAQQPLDNETSISSSAGRSSITSTFGSSWSSVAANNLAPQGRMLWMEPLAHPLALAFHKLVPSAHTRDESPLLPGDLRWIKSRFPGTIVIPINFFTFPAGVVSTYLFSSADNALLRGADAIDELVFRHQAFVPFAQAGHHRHVT